MRRRRAPARVDARRGGAGRRPAAVSDKEPGRPERVRLCRIRDRPRPRPAAIAAPSRRRRPEAGCR